MARGNATRLCCWNVIIGVSMRFDWEDVFWLAAFVVTIVAGAAIH